MSKEQVDKLKAQVGRQSQLRERLKSVLRKAIPGFTFDKYPLLYLHPARREDDRPAWSIGAVRTSTGQLYDVFSQDRMTDCVAFGVKIFYEHWDRAIRVVANYDIDD